MIPAMIPAEKTIIVSVHDVTPYFQRQTEYISEQFKQIPKSWFVTPFWDKKHCLSTDFVQFFKNEDLVLHGLNHQAKDGDWLGKLLAFQSRSDRELYGLNFEQTQNLLKNALGRFEDAFGFSPDGFVPPTWGHNIHSVGLLRQMGFGYTETCFELLHLKTGQRYLSPALCFDYGSNTLLEQLSLRIWKPFFHLFEPSLVRFSIHPSDVENGYLPKIYDLLQTLLDKGYIAMTYQTFFSSQHILGHAFHHHLHPKRGTLLAELA